MITATPVALSFAGRNGVTEGKFTLLIIRKDKAGCPAPAGSFRISLVSAPVCPSDPGATPLHSFTSSGSGGAVPCVDAHAESAARRVTQKPVRPIRNLIHSSPEYYGPEYYGIAINS